jgi:hypothetical protein
MHAVLHNVVRRHIPRRPADSTVQRTTGRVSLAFLRRLPLLRLQHRRTLISRFLPPFFGGRAQLHVQTYSGEDYLVRDVINPQEGTVTINAYDDASGSSPIIASTSSAFDFDIVPVTDHIGVTLDFNNIRTVRVVPATTMSIGLMH